MLSKKRFFHLGLLILSLLFQTLFLFGCECDEPPMSERGAIRATQASEKINLAPFYSVYEDTTAEWTVEDIARLDNQGKLSFTPMDKDTREFVYHIQSEDSVIWLKLKIDNLPQTRDWVLAFDWATYKNLTLYLEKGKPGQASDWIERSVGFQDSHSIAIGVIFSLPKYESFPKTIYLKIENRRVPALYLGSSLQTIESGLQTQEKKMLSFGLFYGVLAIIIFINIFVYLSLRDKNYLYYVIYELSIVLYFLTHDGFLFHIIKGIDLDYLNRITFFEIGLLAFLGTIFSRSFLMTKKLSPWADRFILFGRYLSLATMASAFTGIVEIQAFFTKLLGVTTPIYLMLPSIFVWRKGFQPARFHLFGFAVLALGALFFALPIEGYGIAGFFGFQASAAIEAMLLSLALVDRMRTLREERVQIGEEKKTIEDSLKESEIKFRTLAESTTAGIWIESEDEVIYANNAVTEITGYTIEDIRNTPREEIFDDETLAMVEKLIEQYERDGTIPRTMDVKMKHKQGHWIWLHMSIGHFEMNGEPYHIHTAFNITERKKAEQALLESENRFRALAETTSAVILIGKHDNNELVYANKAASQATGYTPEELMGMESRKLLMPEDAQRIREVDEMMKSGEEEWPERMELEVVSKTGEHGWIELSSGIFEVGGEQYWISTAFDITERKQAQAELLRREAILKTLADIAESLLKNPKWEETIEEFLKRVGNDIAASRAYIFRVFQDSDGKYYMSQKHEWTAEGYAPQIDNPDLQNAPLSGTEFEEVLHALKKGEAHGGRTDSFRGAIRALLEGQDILSFITVPIYISDELYGFIGFDDCETAREWTPAEIDILKAASGILGSSIQRKRMETSLLDSENRYRTIFETTGTGTIIFDSNTVIQLANAEFAKLLGYSRGEMEGKMKWLDFVAEQWQEKMLSYHQRREEQMTDVPRSYETRLIDRYGRKIDGIVTVGLIPGTKLRVASFLDLTERKQAEQQMLRADKMAALGQIIAGVAHEINNPNNFIYFNLPILRRYLEAVRPMLDEMSQAEEDFRILNMPYDVFLEDMFKLLDNMEHGSARITGIVGELKNYIRSHEDETRKPNDLKQVIHHVMTLVGKQVKKMVKHFELTIEDDLPQVVMNPGKIEQVLINLIINAGHAADKEDSRITLSAKRAEAEAGYLLITVEDNGSGIEEETLEKIFDPFFTTKGRESGSGLGLSISHRIIEEHGGRIDAESEPGRYTRFTVVLPYFQGDEKEL